jgi:hypothetical protein
VVAEHSEWMGQGMAAAAVGENAGHADDHRCDQDDEPEDYAHDAPRGSWVQASSGDVASPAGHPYQRPGLAAWAAQVSRSSPDGSFLQRCANRPEWPDRWVRPRIRR